MKWHTYSDKLVSRDTSIVYRIDKWTFDGVNSFTVKAGLISLGKFNTQGEAIHACQHYEDKLNRVII